jgi:hypothetical protein
MNTGPPDRAEAEPTCTMYLNTTARAVLAAEVDRIERREDFPWAKARAESLAGATITKAMFYRILTRFS